MFQSAKKVGAALVAVAALAVGGAAIGSAATSQGATTVTTTPSTHAPPGNMRAPGTAAHEDAEKPVTGDAADEAKAAALKAVGSGTAGDVTTDYFRHGLRGDGDEVRRQHGRAAPRQLVRRQAGAACAVRATPR
jgi:hypothetical protein